MAIKMAIQSEIDVHNILDVFNNVTKIEERKINNQVTWIILLLIGMPHYEIELMPPLIAPHHTTTILTLALGLCGNFIET